jgi:hypothetical protein
VGESGRYLYDKTPATINDPQWDGTQEEDSPNNGDNTTVAPPQLDDLTVYTPTVTEGELSVFLETAHQGATIWVWNNRENFTGGNWNTKPEMTLMGKTADGQRRILKWTFQGNGYQSMPTGLIFVPTGQSQTADLPYHIDGYYVEGIYHHTVTYTEGIDDVKREPINNHRLYDLQGRRLHSIDHLPSGSLYIQNKRLMMKR